MIKSGAAIVDRIKTILFFQYEHVDHIDHIHIYLSFKHPMKIFASFFRLSLTLVHSVGSV